MKKVTLSLTLFIVSLLIVQAQPWVSDLGNGRYKNPIIYADYSDPDLVKVGDDFFMVSSSFNCVPGLPVLHSKDLVNWKIVNHVYDKMPPEDIFSVPQHGNGCWAPSIRYHEGTYYVFFGDPDFGIYMSRTDNPFGEWEPLKLIHEARGWIDPSPLWDDDGNAYLVHAFAGSRSGRKSILVVHRMAPDGSALLDEGKLIYDGHEDNPTIEGPKFYKRNGYYYVFAPAGGVTPGWQTVLRSKNVFGPYEIRTVMHQGNTDINGPHQGGWVELDNGESWFVHFQDIDPYGRLVHLNPMTWNDDWPLIGVDQNDDGIGEPVREYKKPDVRGARNIETPVVARTSDEFNGIEPGLQWQWHANPVQEWMFMSGNLGFMRMYCNLPPEGFVNHWVSPNLFLQKFPAPEFTTTTLLNFTPYQDGDKTGLIIMGQDYAYIGLEQKDGQLYLSQVSCKGANEGAKETVMETVEAQMSTVYLRVDVSEGGLCTFSYSYNGDDFEVLGKEFAAKQGQWIGAKAGLFGSGIIPTNDTGYADYDWFRVE